MNESQIAQSLGNAKKTPQGWVCRCPCHDDNKASLTIKTKADGEIVVNCLAGCDWKIIREKLRELNLLPKFKSNAPVKSNRDIKIYLYLTESGEPVFRKNKLPDKRMWFERYDAATKTWVKGLGEAERVLYNLPKLSNADVIYITEGEKDAETLITRGLVATTNHAGAAHWSQSHNKYFKDKIVVICEDNDPAGKERTAALSHALKSTAKELRLFAPQGLAEKEDVTDWIQKGGDASKILELSTIIQKKENKNATRQDYFELFNRVLKNPRKDVFNGKLMTFDESEQLWNPCVNFIDHLKSEAMVMNESPGPRFSKADIQPHFFSYEATKPKEFLVDIQEWDGEHRISKMAYGFRLKPNYPVSANAVSELIKEWCALAFERLYDPNMQNRIMVLQGKQGIGKDTWTSLLVDGLGQFAIPLSIVAGDKDTLLNLHKGLIMKISEFDKTARTEVSILKDIITMPSTDLRAPYDRDAKLRMSRCSFISSANIENLLRDHTGNRRYMIFAIESIEHFSKGWSLQEKAEWQQQVLAEMYYLFKVKYRASEESQREMAQYIEELTPSDPGDDMLAEFLAELRANLKFVNGAEIPENDPAVRDVKIELRRKLGVTVRGISSLLRTKLGHLKRIGDKRFWYLTIPRLEVQEGATIESEGTFTQLDLPEPPSY